MTSTLIIAEAGVNHNGSIREAMDMCLAARDAGADIVKFQTFDPEILAAESAPRAEYQITGEDDNESQLDMLRKLTLTRKEKEKLAEHCREIGIQFCSSPFDIESARFLKSIGVDLWKIPSGEITNLPLLQEIASYNNPMILSTGMSTMSEIRSAVDILEPSESIHTRLTLLHCNTDYPTDMGDVNLRCMAALSREFGTPIGYSDHTRGIEVPIAAAALGASVIEKHFTMDRNARGPDHSASLTPSELTAMVQAIRNIEIALGSAAKKPTESELKNLPIVRKSIVAARNITRGEILDESNITAKRPGTGISPMRWHQVIGRAAERNYIKDELIDDHR